MDYTHINNRYDGILGTLGTMGTMGTMMAILTSEGIDRTMIVLFKYDEDVNNNNGL